MPDSWIGSFTRTAIGEMPHYPKKAPKLAISVMAVTSRDKSNKAPNSNVSRAKGYNFEANTCEPSQVAPLASLSRA